MKRMHCLFLCLLFCSVLGGCAGADPEDQEFPLVLYIRDAEDIPKTGEYENYYHLKAILLSRELLEDTDQLIQVLSYLESQDEFSRNILVFSMEQGSMSDLKKEDEEIQADAEGQSQEGVPESMGFLLTQLMEQQEWYNRKTETTLGDLLNQWHSPSELLLIPGLNLDAQDEPVLSHFIAMDCFEYKGTIKPETAIASYMMRGICSRVQFEDIEGYDFKIGTLSACQELTVEEGSCKDVITVSGSATVTNMTLNENEYLQYAEELLNQYLSKYLTAYANYKVSEGVDLSNSFKKLAVWDRALYRVYENRPKAWGEQLSITVETKIRVRS